MTRIRRAPGMPCIIPYLTVRDPVESIEFYERAFGFRLRGEPMRASDDNILHAEMTFFSDGVIRLGPEGAFGSNTNSPASQGTSSPITLYVYCENVDELFEQAICEGAQAITLPETMFWGDRVCKLLDPDGYTWNFATYVGEPARAGSLA